MSLQNNLVSPEGTCVYEDRGPGNVGYVTEVERWSE